MAYLEVSPRSALRMTDQDLSACGLGPALSVIAGKWKPTIIWELHLAPLRFSALRRRLPGVSEKVLAEQLQELEVRGVVRRTAYAGYPSHVEYSLTDPGHELNKAVHALALWGSAFARAELTTER